MDGHECADVDEYWNNIFLPAMTRFEACMIDFEGPELRRVESILEPGEKEIIALYDETDVQLSYTRGQA